MRTATLLAAATFLASALLTAPALANGAAWGDHPATGQPGPLKETRLELAREHVTFSKGRATARFWIKNPTSKPITVQIGFPVRVPDTLGGSARGKEEKPAMSAKDVADFAQKHLKPTVTAHGKPTTAAIQTRAQNATYPVTYVWTMTFPAHKTSPFVVSYPMVYSWFTSDFGDTRMTYDYITHTGGYWAKPIGEALFEFCDARVMRSWKSIPGGKLYLGARGRTEVTIQRQVTPKAHRYDARRGCLVWKRKNWTPKKGVDDISVSFSKGTTMPGPLDDMERWENPAELMVDGWCASSKLTPTPLFRFAKITSASFSAKRFSAVRVEALMRLAWHAASSKEGVSRAVVMRRFRALPAHLRHDFDLRLLRYLRNAPGALAGHKFKDEGLAACFKAVKKPAKYTVGAVAKRNIAKIKRQEAATKQKLQRALGKVRHGAAKTLLANEPEIH